MAEGELTNADFVRRLESLFLLARRVLGGTLQADRKSKRKGAGITFADYAQYQLGDDYRAIDWRVFARFDQLVVKLFEIEEDTSIYILLDASHSMESKSLPARQLAAALGYIALSCMDRLTVYGMAETLKPILSPTRGKAKVTTYLRSLENLETFGEDTDFTSCAREFDVRHRKKGVVLVISDFLYPHGFDDGLKRLSGMGHDVYCLQLHDQNDLKCDWKGDVDVECVETGKTEKLTVSSKEARKYEQYMEEWNESLRKECARLGIGLASTTDKVPFDQIIQGILRKGGLVA